jgi:hypothetical protein
VAGRTTPGRLRAMLWLLLVVSLAWGAVAAFTAQQHASAASDVVAVSEPLSLDAEQVYQSLSDADATAANAFLAGGLIPPAELQRYNNDIAAASVRIESASALVGSSAARGALPNPRPGTFSTAGESDATATGNDLAILTAYLPVLTGEVATANADNRLGLPLGAAYLREASGTVSNYLLPAAQDIYTRQNTLLTSASAQATGLPLLTVTLVLGIALCVLLIRSGRWLSRHSHRVVNPGLAGAFVVVVAALVWLASASAVGRSDLLHAQQAGSSPARQFALADVAALTAHADESLTLIDDSGDDSYQADFLTQQAQVNKLLGETATEAAQKAHADAQDWFAAHRALRTQDDDGDHQAAVTSAQTGRSAAAFAVLSADLTSDIGASQVVFADSARDGRDAFTGLAAGLIVAGLLMAASCAWGLNRRLLEYR